jgi:septal ring factor EnvC (AmiA/AmiB activator)
LPALSGAALAQVPGATYRCVDDAGRSTYTNVKEEMTGRKCVIVSREVSVIPATPIPPRLAAPATTPGQPAVDAPTQRTRDADRRRILEQELQVADQQLNDARQKLAQQESQRSGDERNAQRLQDRLKPFQDDVRVAEANVAALRKELSGLR